MSWRNYLSRGRQDREREDELREHFDLLVEEHRARGATRDEAARRARLALGNPRAKREALDDMNRLPILDTLARDVRYAVRVLRRTPAFTITTIVTLALVIGGNTAVMSLADSILVRPLPYPQPDRLGTVVTRLRAPDDTTALRTAQDGISWEVLRDEARSIDAAVTTRGVQRVNIVVDDAAATVRLLRVSAGYFRVLGVMPLAGREFTRDEDRPGGAAVALISHEFWEQHLGRSADIVGKTMQLRGQPHTIVGVMPPAFVELSETVDVWAPLRPSRTGEGVGTNFVVVARLRDGYAWAQADAELAALGRASFAARKRYPAHTDAWWSLRSLQEALVEDTRTPIALLTVGGAIVLLIACVNLAALLLARGAGRAKEVATRMALGCGRAGVVRQLVVESVALGVVGGLAGFLVGGLLLDGVKALGSEIFVQWARVTLDARLLAVTLGISIVASLIFGLLPAIQAARMDVHRGLAAGSRSVAGSSAPWMRRALVGAEVALGVVVLVGAGLLVRTYANLRNLDPGFNPEDVIAASVSLQDARYATSARANQLFDASLEALSTTPGVVSAAVSLELPYRRLLNSGFRFSEQASSAFQMTNVTYATPGFLRTLEIPLRAGRDLSHDDRAGTRAVVIVNETFARSWSRGVNPVGRRIWMDGAEREIVGVFGDVQVAQSGIDFPGRADGPVMHSPLVVMPPAQMADGLLGLAHTWFQPVWTVRTLPSVNGARAIQEALARVDRTLPLNQVQSLAEVQHAAVAPQRLVMMLVGATAGLALLLAVVGIYGLIAQGVAERTRELGIRLALGATAAQAMRRLALGGVAVAVVGAAAGLVLAWQAVSVLDAFLLFRVHRHDPLTFTVVAAVLVVVALLASLLPARRVLRLDPAAILRE